MKHQNRILTGTLSIALALSLTSPAAFAATLEFSDVPTTHWAYSSITRMVEQGVMQGVGNNRFAPEQEISNAEFLAMLVRQFWPDEVSEYSGENWYDPYIQVAKEHQVGYDCWYHPTDIIERGHAAMTVEQFLQRVGGKLLDYPQMPEETKALRAELSVDTPYGVSSYQGTQEDEIARVVYAGIMTGVDDKGTFNPWGTMTRAQAVTILDRMIEYRANKKPYLSGEVGDAYYVTGDEYSNHGTVHFREGIWHAHPDYVRLYGGNAMGDVMVEGYSAITGTITAGATDVRLGFGTYDSEYNYTRYPELNIVIPAGETTSFYYSIPQGIHRWVLALSEHCKNDSLNEAQFSVATEAWLSDVRLVKQ